ncbi:MAG: DUF1576 domain-containing protein [Alkalibacterium sp.]
MLITGLYLNAWTLNGYDELLYHSGQLSTDFLQTNGFSVNLINMAFLGFVTTGYILFLGEELNGSLIGGILIVVGFGAFGNHLTNILPI